MILRSFDRSCLVVVRGAVSVSSPSTPRAPGRRRDSTRPGHATEDGRCTTTRATAARVRWARSLGPGWAGLAARTAHTTPHTPCIGRARAPPSPRTCPHLERPSLAHYSPHTLARTRHTAAPHTIQLIEQRGDERHPGAHSISLPRNSTSHGEIPHAHVLQRGNSTHKANARGGGVGAPEPPFIPAPPTVAPRARHPAQHLHIAATQGEREPPWGVPVRAAEGVGTRRCTFEYSLRSLRTQH
jgi:hypothetical protein